MGFQIQKLEKSLATKKNSFSEACTDEERDFALIEIKYEEEILQLMKEFEKDVGELRLLFSRGNVAEELEEDTRKKYSNEIERIKLYFYQKQMELDEK